MHCRLLLFCLLAGSVSADEAHDSAIIEELLKMHAPPPDWRIQLADPDFLSSIDRRPSEDAPNEEFAEYWEEAPSSGSAPSRQVQLRLIEICTQDREQLPNLLRWFSKADQEIAERLKALSDRVAANPPKGFDPAPLHEWLMEHSPYFREELIAKTRATFSGAGAEALRNAVQTLAGLDRQAAELLLRSLARSDNDFTRTAALVALLAFEGTVSDSERAAWRTELQHIATNPAASARARDYAITGVMRKPWPGDEDWFASLFADSDLAELRFSDQLFAPLCRVVVDQPARWVPKLVAMINAPDRTKHGNAALCLSDIPQTEALRPLLPWLTDSSWSPIGGDAARRRLVGSLARVELPEAVPGLLAMLKHTNPWIVKEAAEALVHQKAKEAGPAVRDALEKAELSDSFALASSAVQLGAFTTGELVQDLEIFGRKTENQQGVRVIPGLDSAGSGQAALPLVIGEICSRDPPPQSDLVDALLRRADDLATKEPAVAERLRVVVAGWGDAAAVAAIAQRLRSGDFSARWLAEVLEPADPMFATLDGVEEARVTLRHRAVTAAFIKIDGLQGLARGVQSALTGIGVHGVLRSNDRSAILALVAAARLARTHLPVSAVAPLLDSADLLQIRAAEQYLISEDSPPARALVLQRHPGEFRILGASDDFAGESEKSDPMEEGFRHWLREPNGPREVYGLLSSGTWGGAGDRAVVILPGEVRFNIYDGPGRRRRRVLSAQDTEKFRRWMAAHRVDELAPFDQGTMDGVQYSYVHLTRDEGRRVFMNNPPGGDRGFSRVSFGGGVHDPDPWVYGRLVEQFVALQRAPMEVVYDELEKLPGYQLIHRREGGEVTTLSLQRQQLLAEIYDRPTGGTLWRVVEERALSESSVPAPESFHAQERGTARNDFFFDTRQTPDPDAGRLKDGHVWGGTRRKDNVQGLWLEHEKGEPE